MSVAISGIKWRFLVIEDGEDKVHQLLEIAPTCVDAPDEVEVVVCSTFQKGAERLRTERFDLIILDLKDDSDAGLEADSNPAGLGIFEELKKTRFIPVVFYTALAHKVRSEQTSFVRVVEKTEDVTKVKAEIRRVLATQLPSLMRHLEDIQRKYMWDFVSAHWRESNNTYEQVDIAYLLARRLALSLQSEARSISRSVAGKGVAIADPNRIHPMEMYIYPPVNTKRLAGDVVKGIVRGVSSYWLVLTPSCDFEQEGRLHTILLSQCTPLTAEPEYLNWTTDPTNIGPLKALIGDGRQNAQSERFKFLPGTYFFPDSIVDFQKLQAVSPEELLQLQVIASLDSPFAEALLARFSRYFGRLGTPDVDKNVVIARLQAAISGGAKPDIAASKL